MTVRKNLHPLSTRRPASFSRDYHALVENGGDDAAFNVFKRQGGTIRHFCGGETNGASADPGQGTDGYPKLNYWRSACGLFRKSAGAARAFSYQIGTAQ